MVEIYATDYVEDLDCNPCDTDELEDFEWFLVDDFNYDTNSCDWYGYNIRDIVLGCSDISACNYDDMVDIAENSYCNYDKDICGVCYGDNSSCLGCMNIDASNYDAEALYEDGSCTFSNDVLFFDGDA